MAQNKIDSLADTSCAGVNWIPLFFTGNTVSVSGFDGQERSKGIPIAMCATMVTTESGSQYILILLQMLWFGKQLSQSLINPNQLRVHETLVKDDPTADGDNEFDLITNNLFIPFSTAGATVYFQPSALTYDQVEQLRHEIIGPEHSDPAMVQLQLQEPENVQQEYD